MPCGGVSFGGPLYPDVWKGECLFCGQEDADHFVDEWDAFIHAECVIPWLSDKNNPEAQIVLNHAHTIVIILDRREREALRAKALKQKARMARQRRVRT